MVQCRHSAFSVDEEMVKNSEGKEDFVSKMSDEVKTESDTSSIISMRRSAFSDNSMEVLVDASRRNRG
jgi:hypothetical protein